MTAPLREAPPEPLAYRIEDLPHVTGCSSSAPRRLIAQGLLPAHRLKGRVVVLRRDLLRYLEALPIVGVPRWPDDDEAVPRRGKTEDEDGR